VLLFVRFLPSIAMAEMKTVLDGTQPSNH